MMSGEARLSEVAAAVLDGTPVDWAAAGSDANGAPAPFLEHLKLVAAVAEVHRNAVSDTGIALGSPTHWGHLQLLERIGGGAFGEVYRAWDTRLDREVALKLLPADPTAGTAWRRRSSRKADCSRVYGTRRGDHLRRRAHRRARRAVDGVRQGTHARAADRARRSCSARSKPLQIGIELCRAVRPFTTRA